ncbi:hypothetical protein OSTOST_26172 [Ostertagia ostertagi]
MILTRDISFGSEVKMVPVNASSGFTKKELEGFMKDSVFGDLPLWDSRHRTHMEKFHGLLNSRVQTNSAEQEVHEVAHRRRNSTSHSPTCITPAQLRSFHAAKIPTWIWLLSGQLVDTIGTLVGVPTFPSYVPPLMMESLDEMNFYERTKSFIGYNLGNILFPRMVVNKETAIMREYWDPDFPDIIDLASKCPLIMAKL